MTSNTYLVHYGVKGMKWGVRKDPKKQQAKEFANAYRTTKRLYGEKHANQSVLKLKGNETVDAGLKLAGKRQALRENIATGQAAGVGYVSGKLMIAGLMTSNPAAFAVGATSLAGSVMLGRAIINDSLGTRLAKNKAAKRGTPGLEARSLREAKRLNRKIIKGDKEHKRFAKGEKTMDFKDPGLKMAKESVERINGKKAKYELDDRGRITRIYA